MITVTKNHFIDEDLIDYPIEYSCCMKTDAAAIADDGISIHVSMYKFRVKLPT